MPVEITQVHMLPSDFFTANPSIDVPSNKNLSSKLTEGACCNGSGIQAATNGNGVNGTNGHA